jgi:2-haloacid dehalogenase
VTKQEVLFVSSNAWDVVGAGWFGFDTFWVNRQALPFEEIGRQPTYESSVLTEILQKIA